MMSEITNPTAPATIKITPSVDSRKPCCWATTELCAVVAQYMIAPVTADTALRTIPDKPMTSPLTWHAVCGGHFSRRNDADVPAPKDVRGRFSYHRKLT